MARLDVRLSFLGSIVLGFMVGLFSPAAQAQVTAATDDTSTPIEGAGHDYIKMLSETVNPANGSVSLRIQAPMPKGRGIAIPFSFSYDSNSVHHLVPGPNPGYVEWQSNTGYLSQGGWGYSIPMASYSNWTETDGNYPNTYSCDSFSNYMFADASGGQHALGLATQYSGSHQGGCNHSGLSVGGGGDPEVYAYLPNTQPDPTYNPSASSPSPVTVFTADGSVYTFPNFNRSLSTSSFALASKIEDRNGNIVTFTDNNNGNFVAHDTAGRAVISSSGFGPSGTTNTLSLGGLTYKATWKTVTANFTTSTPIWAASSPPNPQYDACVPIPAANDSQTVISQLQLPNLKSYTFYYGTDVTPHGATPNPYGLLSEVDYPSGGWVMYSWKLSDWPNELADYPGSYNVACGGNTCTNPVMDGCLYQYSTPVVASREVGFGSGNSPALTQTFRYGTSWGAAGTAAASAWTGKSTVVVTTDDVRNQSQTTIYSYSPITVGTNNPIGFTSISPQVPVESTVQRYDFDSSLPRTEVKSWYNQFNLQSDTTEELVNGSPWMSEVAYCYTGANCAPTFLAQLKTKSEYGYGQGVVGPLLRQTTTTFQSFSNTPGYIEDAPCTTVVYDGSNNRYAETDYLYDGGTTLCGTVSSATATTGVTVVSGTHDEVKFGPSLTIPRGNVTQKTQWASSGNSPVTTYTYDETGQVLTMTDPCGNGTCGDVTGSSHTTTYSYGDSFATGTSTCSSANGPQGNTNSLLTKVVYPPTNGVVHSECFSYDYTSGQLTGLKDENQQLTTYAYSDPFFRPTLASYPDGGQTTLAYSDVAPSPSVTSTKLISSGVSLSTTTVMDGMGHVVQSKVTTDPDGSDYVDTTYDGNGRVLTRSNPHRSSTLPTDGTTTYTYDALGRTTLVQEPDGSSTQTLYDQTCRANTNAIGTGVTDEAGKQRLSCADGLGRLVEVDEPGSTGLDGQPGTGSVTFSGNEQGPLATCPQQYGYCYVWDNGTFNVTIDGILETASYGDGSTSSSIASGLAATINSDNSVPVTASANGATVTLTSKSTESVGDYSLSASLAGSDTQWFPTPSFSVSSSGSTLSGGTSGTPWVTLYTYDPLNNLTCAVQKGTDTTAFSTCASALATWRPRSFVYDSLSRLTSATNPESGTINYAYDLNSNLSSKIAPRAGQTGSGQTTTSYFYDALNRLYEKSYANPATPLVVYGYDGIAPTGCVATLPPSITATNLVGRRSSMCAQYGASSWSYDSLGRALVESQTNKGSSVKTLSVGYTYNLDGSLKTLTYPSGDIVTYTTGGAGRATQATDPTNNFVMSGTYAPAGLLTGMTNGTGIVTSNSYNDRLQPVLLSAGVTGQNPIFSLCYDFHSHVAINSSPCSFSAYTSGDNGNVFQVLNNVDTTRSTVFTYDSLNRLSQANTINTTSANCWGEVYTIDTWGNLTNRSVPSGMSGGCYTEGLSATATTLNQLSGIGVLYDAAGNVTNDGNGNTPTYNAENRISTDAGVTYQYDADGVRIQKSSGTMYWPGPSGALTETDLTGTINEEYIYFNGERIARVDRPSGTVHYYFSDKLGSASVIASSSGAAQVQYFYYPYGGMQSSVGSDPNHYKFTGKERDTESGLDEFGARYYTSSMGRFMTPDWAARPTAVPYAVFGDPQSLNLYTYVRNDPVTRADADGHVSHEALCPGGDACPDPLKTEKDDNPKPQAQNTSSCGFWCKVGQALGFVETDAEKKAAAGQRDWINRNVTTQKNGKPPDTSHMSDRQVTNYYNMIMMGLMMGRIPIAGSSGPGSPDCQTDPAQSPGAGWEWRGKGPVGSSEGSWYNAGTNESFHPDLSHPDPIGPHYDYRDALGNDYRVFPDGTVVPK